VEGGGPKDQREADIRSDGGESTAEVEAVSRQVDIVNHRGHLRLPKRIIHRCILSKSEKEILNRSEDSLSNRRPFTLRAIMGEIALPINRGQSRRPKRPRVSLIAFHS